MDPRSGVSRLLTAIAVLLLVIFPPLGHADTAAKGPSYDECRSLYGERKFIRPERMRIPPMLFTFPGSGTTITQLLVEYATGVLTGSIYDEDELYHVMPGLRFCGQRLGMVKAHTKDVRFAMHGDSIKAAFIDKPYTAKCRRGAIPAFDRFLLVVRDPWASIWSNFQRDFNFEKDYMNKDESDMKSHTGGIPMSEFNRTRWHWKFENSPHYGLPEYFRMWDYGHSLLFHKHNYTLNTPGYVRQNHTGWKDYEDLVNYSRASSGGKSKSSSFSSSSVAASVKDTGKDLLVVRYEDLIRKDEKGQGVDSPSPRLQVLKQIIDFVGLKTDGRDIEGGSRDENFIATQGLTGANFTLATDLSADAEEQRRLRCAYVLSENPDVHRSVSTPATSADGKALEQQAVAVADNSDVKVTKRDAYADQEWVCAMWRRILERGPAPEMRHFGYLHGPLGSGPPEGCSD
jgi:hypothetical protein